MLEFLNASFLVQLPHFSHYTYSMELERIGIKFRKKTYTKSFQILCRKKISMLTGLKVSPLARKCVFYRPDHNTNGGPMKMNFGLEMQK